MHKDEIVEEIHRIREEYSRSFNHDLKAIFADLQKQQAESDRPIVSLSEKVRSDKSLGQTKKRLGQRQKEYWPSITLATQRESEMVSSLKNPSSLIHEIQLEKVGNWNLFKFSEHLQSRMEVLLEKKKADRLTTDEIAELDVIGELDRIFTHMNAMLAAQDTN